MSRRARVILAVVSVALASVLGAASATESRVPVNGCFQECKNIEECWWHPDAYFCSVKSPWFPCESWYEPDCFN